MDSLSNKNEGDKKRKTDYVRGGMCVKAVVCFFTAGDETGQ